MGSLAETHQKVPQNFPKARQNPKILRQNFQKAPQDLQSTPQDFQSTRQQSAQSAGNMAKSPERHVGNTASIPWPTTASAQRVAGGGSPPTRPGRLSTAVRKQAGARHGNHAGHLTLCGVSAKNDMPNQRQAPQYVRRTLSIQSVLPSVPMYAPPWLEENCNTMCVGVALPSHFTSCTGTSFPLEFLA